MSPIYNPSPAGGYYYGSFISTTTVTVPAWNYVLELEAGDYLQFCWSSADANMQLQAQTGLTTPTRPDIPSAAVTAFRF